MAINAKHNNTEFGVGDRVKVTQKIKEGDKERSQVFDGMVIKIKGEGENKSFTVRRMGVQQIGIERIYPLFSPTIEMVQVVRKGVGGIKRAKLYYTRSKSKKEIEKIYSREGKKSLGDVQSNKVKATVKKRKVTSSQKNARSKSKK